MPKTAIREVTAGLHTFSRPFQRFGLFSIGARSALLKLSDESWALTSPVSLKDDETPLDYIKSLGGTISLIIAPDLAHYLSIPEWLTHYPDAKVIGVEGHASKLPNVNFHTLFTRETDPASVCATLGIQDLEFIYFAGFEGRDLVTLHKPTRSIIEADLIFNLPALEQYGGIKQGGCKGFMNILRKDSKWMQRIIWQLGKDKANMTTQAKRVLEWDFINIIPCHGEIILGDGKEVWKFVFARYLK